MKKPLHIYQVNALGIRAFFLTSCFLVLFSFSTKAQFHYFNKAYPEKASNITYDLFQETDTSFIVKSPFTDSAGKTGLRLFKINAAGVKYMQKDFYFLDSSVYFTFGQSMYATINRVVRTSASSFFSINGFINKYNKQSVIITKHNIVDLDTTLITLISDSTYEYDVEQCKLLPDGSFTIIGTSFDNSNTSIPSKTLFVNMDTMGHIKWQNNFLIGVNCTGYCMEYNTITKGYIITGLVNTNTANFRTYIVSTDSVGNITNSHILRPSGIGSSFFYNVISLSDGNFMVCGEYDTVQALPSTFYAGKPYFIKVSNAGDIIWQKDMYPISGMIGTLISTVELNDGSFMACGYNTDVAYNTVQDTAIWGVIMKIDSGGNLLWDRRYKPPVNSQSFSLNNIKKISDTTFVTCGQYKQGTTFRGWILTLDKYGCDTANCITAGIEQVSDNSYELTVYPNPASTVIQLSGNGYQVLGIRLIDVLGNEVLQSKQSSIDVSAFPDGIYFIQVKTSSGTMSKRIVIQH